MKYKINQVFHSIQGEGLRTGTPAIFIRFAGCNLYCDWCDTNHNTNFEWTKEELWERITPYQCKYIILTGGEPSLQVDKDLLKMFQYNYNVCIETNGENELEHFPSYYWTTVSPKNTKFKQKYGDELKLVYTGQSEDELNYYLYQTDFDYYFLQPCDGMNNLKDVIDIVKRQNKWRLSCQIQKLIQL